MKFELADGEVQGTWNTTISVGTKYDLKGYETPNGLEQNENDGDRSFDGGFVSKALKLTSELELKKDNYGAFVRGTAYYDDVLMNGKNKWDSNNASDVAKAVLTKRARSPAGQTMPKTIRAVVQNSRVLTCSEVGSLMGVRLWTYAQVIRCITGAKPFSTAVA